ncbi:MULTISPECIES: hypothetical protein [Bacteria]|jgi:hypothetical protein|uniref:hypothetical protein n=1 Tax=Bacteria TaxID=2 RepID=UPI0009D1B283|nr:MULTISPECIES: hypothetical protein [Bacteria]MBD9867900.1 hypothetical protein [Enterococcus faecalis]MCO5541964.1 hypothetical protein [Enterococcus faecalis]MCU2205763.1 hypothetical protein [Enterococcus faecalis]MCU2224619.1 hypothetical protein [Enterococcus faecalis]MCU2250581.1 hypothetical protein [Enterococcus faecalis]
MSKQELVDKNEVLSIWHNYWESDKLAYEAEDELRELKTIICITELNENQQIVLDWLKANVGQDNASPMCAVFLLGEWQTRIGSKELRSIDIAYCRLNPKQQAEVLQAFCQWAIEQEEK